MEEMNKESLENVIVEVDEFGDLTLGQKCIGYALVGFMTIGMITVGGVAIKGATKLIDKYKDRKKNEIKEQMTVEFDDEDILEAEENENEED